MPRAFTPPYTYTLPAVYLAVPGTTILVDQHNSPLQDIQTTLNQAWPVNLGGTGGTTPITSWDAINIRGTDIASASSISLTTATGPNLHITGTTTINTVSLSDGSVRYVIANAAFTITASATLVVNGSTSVNYTTTAGDSLLFIGDPLGVTRVWSSGSGTLGLYLPLAGGTMTGALVNTNATAGVSQIQTVNTDAGAGAGPVTEDYRNSASAAVNDVLGQDLHTGRNSTPAKVTYAKEETVIIDPTAASEDASRDHYAMVAGSLTRIMSVGPNLDLAAIGQIKFPATQNPSSNVNTLDDYEEGTTTPTVTSSGGTFTSVSAALRYTKIGSFVSIVARISIATVGTATGTISLPLPFAAVTGSSQGGGGCVKRGDGIMGTASVASGASAAIIAKYDASTLIAADTIDVFVNYVAAA